MTEPRTVTVPTIDHGPVTLTEPSWCAGHDPAPQYRIDLFHRGPAHTLTFRGKQIARASLVQAPFAAPANRLTEASATLVLEGATLDPVGLYDLAAALDRHADQLRDLADQMHAILAGGER